VCAGDCDGDGALTADELMRGARLSLALGTSDQNIFALAMRRALR
jgi:hypothetical protein